MKHCLEGLIPDLLDPQARSLAETVQWWNLDDQSFGGPVPVAVVGDGPTLLLLHGFDSSFLEFRRLAPLISGQFRLIIPDLFGFGFSPRPRDGRYGPSGVLDHLEALLRRLDSPDPVGLIGASMGGSVAVELARRSRDRIRSLLLLAPAGLTGRPMPVPPPLDRRGGRRAAAPRGLLPRRPGVGWCRAAADRPQDGDPAATSVRCARKPSVYY